MSIVEKNMKEIEELNEKSTLQYGANKDKINELFQEIIWVE